jgi:hypothetical protein
VIRARRAPILALLAACGLASVAASGAAVAAEPVAASAGPVRDADLEAIVDGLVGAWDNRSQYEAAPAALKVPPTVEGEWLDLQHARFTRVAAPALGSHVVYLEWRRGGPDGEISRQRLWSFRRDAAGKLVMDFYAFRDGAPYAGQWISPHAFMAVTPDQLRGYPPGCELDFARQGEGLFGAVGPERCSIVAASGRRMGILAEIDIGASGTLGYRESGRLEDGRYAFRVPPSQPYRFQRVAQPAAAAFFEALRTLCATPDRVHRGRIEADQPPPPPGDPFTGKALEMSVARCTPDTIALPFAVGEDRSRTWVIRRTAGGLRLKHDHRHADGSPDELTDYGGDALRDGTSARQSFEADAESIALFTRTGRSVSVVNVWALEIVPGERFVYELARPGGRLFRVVFDLRGP